jgi:hypothetical protein
MYVIQPTFRSQIYGTEASSKKTTLKKKPKKVSVKQEPGIPVEGDAQQGTVDSDFESETVGECFGEKKFLLVDSAIGVGYCNSDILQLFHKIMDHAGWGHSRLRSRSLSARITA